MERDGRQTETVLTADRLLGPYTKVRQGLRPLGMDAGDFDLAVGADGKGYYFFDRVHSELICAGLTDDYTGVTGEYSAHFPRKSPPFVREGIAHFCRGGKHYLLTSGTTGYFPNPSEIAVADTWHGPYRVLGDPHPNDPSHTSYHSQVSCVFRVPGKKDLFIALAGRWLPGQMFLNYEDYAGCFEALFDPAGGGKTDWAPVVEKVRAYEKRTGEHVDFSPDCKDNTSISDYVWLPIRGDVKKIAVIGPHAGNARHFFGGYTHLSMVEAIHAAANSLAGVDAANSGHAPTVCVPGTQVQWDETEEFDTVLRKLKPGCKNLLEALQSRLPDVEITYAYGYPIAGNDTSRFGPALEAAKRADLVLLTLGGKNGSGSIATMGEGVDGADINLPFCQEEFIRQAARLGKPMVGLHFDGRPISSDAADAHLSAILKCWNPAECGARAIVSVLLGENNPSGKLPVSVAYHAGQIPVFYNHPNGSAWHQGESIGFQNYVDLTHMPRYCFGHGLSYTGFAYESRMF